MTFKIELPQSFEEQFRESLKEMYQASLEQARRDHAMNQEILTIQQAMEFLNCSRNTLMKYSSDYGLKISKIESKMYIRKKDIYQFLKENELNQGGI